MREYHSNTTKLEYDIIIYHEERKEEIHPTYHSNISHNNRKINHQIVSSELLL